MLESSSFLRNFLRHPQAVGALAPAAGPLAREVAHAARETYRQHRQSAGPLRLLELGAGTGALTGGLSSLRPVLVERDAAWAALLRQRFPELEVRQECALQTLAGLDQPTGIVTSIPLWNNPQSAQLKELLLARYAEGLVRFCVLYTYGWTNPLGPDAFRQARRASFVPRNLPPAHVWVYQ